MVSLESSVLVSEQVRCSATAVSSLALVKGIPWCWPMHSHHPWPLYSWAHFTGTEVAKERSSWMSHPIDLVALFSLWECFLVGINLRHMDLHASCSLTWVHSHASLQDYLVCDLPVLFLGYRKQVTDGQGSFSEGVSYENTYGKCILDSGKKMF